MRLKRLYSEWQRMQILNNNATLLDIKSFGDPPERYLVNYYCKGLLRLEGNPIPSISCEHQLEIYLHKRFPHFPPQLHWLTNIFHPNILPPERNGGVCIGNWSPAETLDQLCIRIGEMVQYRNFSVNDPLNQEAARWASDHLDDFPLDERNFWNNGVIYDLR